MTDQTREARLSRAFVSLADTLVADFDLVDLLQNLVETCADLFDVSSAGLLLKNADGEPHVMASTTEDAQFVEVVQLAAAVGPCLECLETGQAVGVPDIASARDRWPRFADAALERGLVSVHATPMRLRDEVIGTVNLFDTKVGALNDEDIAAAQALTDVATIGVLSDRSVREKDLVNAQLDYALTSRIVIEQAKGVLAQSMSLSMDDAFALLRAYSRSNNLTIRGVASSIVRREVDLDRLRAVRAARPPARPGFRLER